jgi:predicted dehydrogenase/threonine dehydrogenase-like Zn-dependent dehydrogenase
MKQVLIKKGAAVVEDVPSPNVDSGSVLVNVFSSCISVGTEMSGIKTTALPLWKRALQQPENVKKVVESVNTLGFQKTKQLVQGQLEAGNVTGYSAAGRVIAVGKDVKKFEIGDLVACAGAQSAHHAEVINVPQNLVVKIPEGVEISHASSVTLGAIALQGVRRLKPTLGETFVVVGLGILGQLAVQMLRANGCNVIGIDLDKSRTEIAGNSGMNLHITLGDINKEEQVYRLTNGFGADGVIITAATSSDEVISSAFKMCRKKGRVVIVGDIGLNLKRADIYSKELDVLISCSYGPGRYDGNYEEKGLDYPIGYVRWTENRNMQAYLGMLRSGMINLSVMSPKFYDVSNAPQAYLDLNNSVNKPLLTFLQYPVNNEVVGRVVINNKANISKHGSSIVKVALVGAGGFAKAMHLPNLQALSKQFLLTAVMSRTGHNAIATAKRYGAKKSTTSYDEILSDNDVDAIIIATRHSLHAEMALMALEAGKHVLLEKPMALTCEELNKFEQFYAKDSNCRQPLLMVGYNRRFSKYAQEIYSAIANRSNPIIINYTMNAGYIPLDHWVHGKEGGGRNIGEACHIYDLFTFLTNSKVKSLSAHSISPNTFHYSKSDNFVATISFDDGSVANLTYTALGDKKFPKERMEIFVDGKIFYLNDYKSLDYFGYKGKTIKSTVSEKGQKEELIAWGKAIQEGLEWPIPFWQQVQATQISFDIDNLINQ